MKKKAVAFLLFALIAVIAVGGVNFGVNAESEPTGNLDVIIIDNEGYKKDKKGPVEFSHKKHSMEYKIICWDCHHNYKDDKNVWAPWDETKKCNQCHHPSKKDVSEVKLQKAYHLSCKGCHKALAEKEKKHGEPRKCGHCHIKVEK